MEDNSGKITVYNVLTFDIVQGKNTLSGRMATKDGAKKMHGEILPETATLIEAKDLEPCEEWTVPGFKPGNS